MTKDEIPDGHKQWLDIINRASENGDLGIMRGKLKKTGEWATILIAKQLTEDGNDWLITPLAHLPDDNPFEYFVSCIDADDFHPV